MGHPKSWPAADDSKNFVSKKESQKLRRTPLTTHCYHHHWDCPCPRIMAPVFILSETSAGYALFKSSDKKLLKRTDIADKTRTAEDACTLYVSLRPHT